MGALKGKNVLLTGATGLLGPRVYPVLEEAEAEIVPVSLSLHYDLRNEAEVLSAFLLAKPDIVVHLAALTPGASENTARLIRENLLIDMNVLHACAMVKAKLVTVGVKRLSREEFPACHAFGTAKEAFHEACKVYRRRYGIPYACLVPGELYGPDQDGRRSGSEAVWYVVRRIAEAAEKSSPAVTLRGTGKETRRLLHTEDAALAVVSACMKDDLEDPIELPGLEIQASKLASVVAEELGYTGEIKWDGNPLPTRSMVRLDGSSAEKILDWKPSIQPEAGLRTVVTWLRPRTPEPASRA